MFTNISMEGDNRMKLLIALCFLYAGIANAANGIYPLRSQLVPSGVKPTADTRLVYYGGPVISNVKVFVVYWGSSVDTAIQQGIGKFYNSLVASTHMDWLNQYATDKPALDGRQGTNQTIGRGSFLGEAVITPSHSGNNIDDKDVQAELEYQVSIKKLPTPDANTIFMIYFPSGITNSIEGMKSCQQFCAYHMGFKSKSYGDVFYGVMPDIQSGACVFGCGGFGGNVFESITAVSSHELVEAVTDPYPTPADKPVFPQAWNTTKGEEIADLCTTGRATLQTPGQTYSLSGEWDNSKGSCNNDTFKSGQ